MISDEHQAYSMQDEINFGELLKSTRESIGLTMQDMGLRMRLSPQFISVFENEDLTLSKIPPIYLRGYLRSYARLLNIPEERITAALDKLNPPPAAATMMSEPAEGSSPTLALDYQSTYARIATFFISLALLLTLTVSWYLHSSNSAKTVVAVTQVVTPELQNNQPLPYQYETPLNTKNINLATAPNITTKEDPVQAPINLATKKQIALPSPAHATPDKDDGEDAASVYE